MAVNPLTLASGQLRISYIPVQGSVPVVRSIHFNNNDLAALIQVKISSTLLGTCKYPPFKESISLDPSFKKLSYDIFDEITNLHTIRPDLAVSCADFFFNHTCSLYWNLIANNGSKNLACALLEEVCLMVNRWERSRRRKIHKGTPYYFLTFAYREMGDIDSAFASAFKATREDQTSLDPILGAGAYRNSPAYKYVTLVDDTNNYLYDVILQLRKMLEDYVKKFNSSINYTFSINDIDTRFLRNTSDLEHISHFFVYILESIKKYLEQPQTLPNNDFYRIKNSRDIFNLCLITDKILEFKYKTSFRTYIPRRPMYMSDEVVLLFEDKHWIGALTPAQKRDPKGHMNISPSIPNDPSKLIKALALNQTTFTFNLMPLNNEMRFVLLAYELRNIGAHAIEKQSVFVSKYKEIVKNLLFSIFVAINAL